MLGPTLRVLVLALVLLVAVMFALPRPAVPLPETENATPLPRPLLLPEFSLLDVDGEPFTKASLRGRFSLMFFGFTNCPDVCPITLSVLASAAEQIEARAPQDKPDVVFVSVDPNRDSRERIRAYVAAFDPAFEGVTGSDERLEPLLTQLGVAVEKHEHDGEAYNVVHSSFIFMIGLDAEVIAVSSSPHVPETLAEDFLKIRRWYLAGGLENAPSPPAAAHEAAPSRTAVARNGTASRRTAAPSAAVAHAGPH